MGDHGHPDDRTSIAILGAGRVGATTAYAALITGLVDSLTLVDQDQDRAEGEAMDLLHGAPFLPPARLRSGGLEECADADLIILTAGVARQPGEPRLDLARKNLELTRRLVPQVYARNPRAIWLVVSNPVDLLTLEVQKLTGADPAQVIGSGTMLDTARLRSLLAQHFQIDAHNVHAAVIGEHGDSEVPVWSLARIANLGLEEFARILDRPWSAELQARIGEQVRTAGGEVIKRKGATHYAIGLATVKLARAILRDERAVFTVSTVLDGEQGLTNIALSLPCLLGRGGRLKAIPLALAPEEQKALDHSAEVLRQAYREATGS